MAKRNLTPAAMIAGLLLAATAPAVAQQAVPQPTSPAAEAPQDRGYDKHDARHDGVDSTEKPVTQQLNQGQAAAKAATVDWIAQDRARYEADMREYRAVLRANRRTEIADEIRVARQERLYADAMAAWREQVRACEKGKVRKCEQPAPDPSLYY